MPSALTRVYMATSPTSVPPAAFLVSCICSYLPLIQWKSALSQISVLDWEVRERKFVLGGVKTTYQPCEGVLVTQAPQFRSIILYCAYLDMGFLRLGVHSAPTKPFLGPIAICFLCKPLSPRSGCASQIITLYSCVQLQDR